MNQQYRQKIEEINQPSYNNATIEMNTVYKEQKATLNAYHGLIALIYLHYSINGLLAVKGAVKRAILNEVNSELDKIYKDLGDIEEKTDRLILSAQYQDLYNQTSKVTNGMLNKRLSIPKLSPTQIDKAVNTPIDGELFSSRIWKNKEDLVNKLKKCLDEILKGKITIDQAGKEIENIFGVTAYESKRLLETELSRIGTQASIDTCKLLGIKKHMWSATFENTCKECIALDGTVFDIEDKKAPSIPKHPSCRCVFIPWIE